MATFEPKGNFLFKTHRSLALAKAFQPSLRASGQNYLSGGRKPPEFRSSQGAYAPRSGFCPLALTLLARTGFIGA
jgi:hypothetical protein